MDRLLNSEFQIVYRQPVDCGKCTRYGNEYVPYNRCTTCRKNQDIPVKVVKLGRILSRVIFDGELSEKLVFTSRLRSVVMNEVL